LIALGDYRGGRVAAWLFRIARSTVADHYRRARTTRFASLDAIEQGDRSLEPAADDTQPLDRLVVSEEQAAVRDLVNALDDDERDLLALRVAAGLSAEEVGAVIGKSAGAVRVGVHRLIKRLRGDLRRWMDSDDSEEDAR
jgi:RNA polymerase sigma-70 factor (ECF subfamily)